MKITDELRKEMAQVLGQRHVSVKTAQDILLICKNGLTAREALMMRGETNPNKDTLTGLRKKSEIWLLNRPDMQKLAHNVHKRAMQGKPIVGKYKKDGKDCENVMLPEFKHALAAASMVTDRTEPKVQEVNIVRTSIHADLDMSQYRDPLPTQDAVIIEEMDMSETVESNEIKRLQHDASVR
jgi:hypothetical protein